MTGLYGKPKKGKARGGGVKERAIKEKKIILLYFTDGRFRLSLSSSGGGVKEFRALPLKKDFFCRIPIYA